LKIKTNLIILSAVAVALFITIGLIVLFTSKQINSEREMDEIAEKLTKDMLELNIVASEYLVHHEKRTNQQWKQKYKSINNDLENVFNDKLARLSPGILGVITKDFKLIGNLFQRLEANYTKKKNLVVEDKNRAEIERIESLDGILMTQLSLKSQMLSNECRKLSALIWERMSRAEEKANWSILISLIIFVVAICVVSYFVIKSTTASIKKLSEGAAIIGQGDFGYRVETKTRSEIGTLTVAFNKMVEDLKESSSALLESEEKFRSLFENSAIGMVLGDESGRYLKVNRAMTEILGYSQEEFLCMRTQDITYKGDVTPKSDIARQLWIGERDSFHVEKRYIHKDGHVIWGDVTVSAIHDSNGKTNFTLGQLVDITERKKAEEDFEKSKRQFYALAEASPYIIFRADTQGKATYVSKHWYRVSGLADGQWVEDGWSTAIHPDDREEIFLSWQQTVTENQPFNKEFRFKHINGEVTWVLSFAKKIHNEIGEAEGFVGICVDITERKKTEDELEQKKYYLEKAQEIGSIGTWELDINENKLIWTDENYRTFGLPVGTELTYELFLKCVHPDDRDYVDKEWKAALNNKPYDIEHRIIVDGKIKWVREKADLEFDEKENFISGIGFTQDITERKKMEETILHSEKLKSLGIITAGVAHEFNNILAVMVGSAELLEDGFKDDEELKKVLGDIIKAGDDGAEIVRNMLKFAKSEGKGKSGYIFFDIKHLINDALEFAAPRWRNMAQANGIDYKIDKEGMREIPDVLCNTTEMREVFTNIVNNALDAMPDGGTLSFSTWSDDDNVFISIADTGKGMPEEVKRKIFDPFFTTRRPLGTGLGMSVSYSIIMRHGGRIEVESEVGKGATFNMTIPIGKDSIQKTVPLEPAFQATTRKLHVLVVDDCDEMCVIIGNVITRDGHTVKTINNGAGAIELFGKEDFDLVLCDLAMPDVYGYEVIKAINNSDKMPKIGIMTGWDEKLKPIDDEEFKVDFILKKPFKHVELSNHINRLFGADG